jgi:hypothetical protein
MNLEGHKTDSKEMRRLLKRLGIAFGKHRRLPPKSRQQIRRDEHRAAIRFRINNIANLRAEPCF